MLSRQAVSDLLRAGFTQHNRLLSLHTPLGENKLVAETLQGWEAIDEGGFRFELTALSDDAHISLESPASPSDWTCKPSKAAVSCVPSTVT